MHIYTIECGDAEVDVFDSMGPGVDWSISETNCIDEINITYVTSYCFCMFTSNFVTLAGSGSVNKSDQLTVVCSQ